MTHCPLADQHSRMDRRVVGSSTPWPGSKSQSRLCRTAYSRVPRLHLSASRLPLPLRLAVPATPAQSHGPQALSPSPHLCQQPFSRPPTGPRPPCQMSQRMNLHKTASQVHQSLTEEGLCIQLTAALLTALPILWKGPPFPISCRPRITSRTQDGICRESCPALRPSRRPPECPTFWAAKA